MTDQEEQGYTSRLVRICGNCCHISLNTTKCTLGGFALIVETGSCDKHELNRDRLEAQNIRLNHPSK